MKKILGPKNREQKDITTMTDHQLEKCLLHKTKKGNRYILARFEVSTTVTLKKDEWS
jgi:hypothetical protein